MSDSFILNVISGTINTVNDINVENTSIESIQAGSNVKVIADKSPSGCRFDYWKQSNNTRIVSKDNKYLSSFEFKMPAKDIELYANYIENRVTVENGSIDEIGVSSKCFKPGEIVNISADIKSDESFVKWIDDNNYLIDNTLSATSFMMPNNDVNLTASFDDLKDVNVLRKSSLLGASENYKIKVTNGKVKDPFTYTWEDGLSLVKSNSYYYISAFLKNNSNQVFRYWSIYRNTTNHDSYIENKYALRTAFNVSSYSSYTFSVTAVYRNNTLNVSTSAIISAVNNENFENREIHSTNVAPEVNVIISAKTKINNEDFLYWKNNYDDDAHKNIFSQFINNVGNNISSNILSFKMPYNSGEYNSSELSIKPIYGLKTDLRTLTVSYVDVNNNNNIEDQQIFKYLPNDTIILYKEIFGYVFNIWDASDNSYNNSTNLHIFNMPNEDIEITGKFLSNNFQIKTYRHVNFINSGSVAQVVNINEDYITYRTKVGDVIELSAETEYNNDGSTKQVFVEWQDVFTNFNIVNNVNDNVVEIFIDNFTSNKYYDDNNNLITPQVNPVYREVTIKYRSLYLINAQCTKDGYEYFDTLTQLNANDKLYLKSNIIQESAFWYWTAMSGINIIDSYANISKLFNDDNGLYNENAYLTMPAGNISISAVFRPNTLSFSNSAYITKINDVNVNLQSANITPRTPVTISAINFLSATFGNWINGNTSNYTSAFNQLTAQLEDDELYNLTSNPLSFDMVYNTTTSAATYANSGGLRLGVKYKYLINVINGNIIDEDNNIYVNSGYFYNNTILSTIYNYQDGYTPSGQRFKRWARVKGGGYFGNNTTNTTSTSLSAKFTSNTNTSSLISAEFENNSLTIASGYISLVNGEDFSIYNYPSSWCISPESIITISAEYIKGAKFENWINNGSTAAIYNSLTSQFVEQNGILSNNPINFHMTSGDLKIKAIYSPTAVFINVISGIIRENSEPTGYFDFGTTITLDSIYPPSGHVFSGWLPDNIIDQSFLYTVPENTFSSTITATYVKNTLTLTNTTNYPSKISGIENDQDFSNRNITTWNITPGSTVIISAREHYDYKEFTEWKKDSTTYNDAYSELTSQFENQDGILSNNPLTFKMTSGLNSTTKRFKIKSFF